MNAEEQDSQNSVFKSPKEILKNITLDREAVEAAIEEFNKQPDGLAWIKAEYGYGTPQKDWFYREGDDRRYPCKAIIGIAYGYAKGGRSLSQSEFYNSYGEKEARSEVRRLGYRYSDESQNYNSFANEIHPEHIMSKNIMHPLNQILYEPPGTGKTYHTAKMAVEICDGIADDDRAVIMERYKTLVKDGRVGFVTFHQSFSYEEFVEGLRPEQSDDGEEAGFSLKVSDGVFKTMAKKAAKLGNAISDDAEGYDVSGRNFFKMSLASSDGQKKSDIFTISIENNCIQMDSSNGINWANEDFATKEDMVDIASEKYGLDIGKEKGAIAFPYCMSREMDIGDIVIIASGRDKFRAICEIIGEYEFIEGGDDISSYPQRRAVKWLWIDEEGVSHDAIYQTIFDRNTCGNLINEKLNLANIQILIDSYAREQQGEIPQYNRPYVLIIDEINRANISKVFGELITLLEDDKRLGQGNEVTLTLPYSKERFSVPPNLYLIGTMNTADRSIALLDTALRRRFHFQELMPNADILGVVDGINCARLLHEINQKIVYFADREHQIGHAYFMGCQNKGDLDRVMRHKVIPLMQEYFFEDWSKVYLILGDGFIEKTLLQPPANFDGDEQEHYRVKTDFALSAYHTLLGDEVDDGDDVESDEDGENEQDEDLPS